MLKCSALAVSLLIHGGVLAVFLLPVKEKQQAAMQLGGELNHRTQLEVAHVSVMQAAPVQSVSPMVNSPVPQSAQQTLAAHADGIIAGKKSDRKKEQVKKTEPRKLKPAPNKSDRKPINDEPPAAQKIEASKAQLVENPIKQPSPKPAAEISVTPESTTPEQTANITPQQGNSLRNKKASFAGDGMEANLGLAQGVASADSSHWQNYKRRVFEAINSQQKYPKQARLRRLEGTVVVSFTINKKGAVQAFDLAEKHPSKILNRSAYQLFETIKLPQPPAEVMAKFPAQMSIVLEYALN